MSRRGNVRFKSDFYKTYPLQFVGLGGVSHANDFYVMNNV